MHLPTLPKRIFSSFLFLASVATQAADWSELPLNGNNSVWADPAGAYVLASSGKTFQISRDQGATWTQAVEPQAKGRHWDARGFQGDIAPGRVALFPIDSPIGWLTTDGGATWTTFAKPKPPAVKKHDGWTYGSVDWSVPAPVRFLGKEHHTTNLWFSADAGATWKQLSNASGYFGFGFAPDGALLIATVQNEKGAARIPGDGTPGVYLSTDDGGTWKLVHACSLVEKTALARHGDRLYWLTTDGMITSDDAGRTWKPLPGAPGGARFGPYFGKSADEILLVSNAGVHRTQDGGTTWKLVVPKAGLPPAIAKAPLPGYAYDPVHRHLYATAMGVALYRINIP